MCRVCTCNRTPHMPKPACSTWVLIPIGVISLSFEPAFACRHMCHSFYNNTWIWIVLTQQFTLLTSVLNTEWNRPALRLVSLLNNSVNKSPWTAEISLQLSFHQFLCFLNHGMLDDLFVWDEIGRHFDICYNVHNFDGHKQKLDRLCSF